MKNISGSKWKSRETELRDFPFIDLKGYEQCVFASASLQSLK